jgi:hypothetical protein
MKRLALIAIPALASLTLAACVPTEAPSAIHPAGPGFLEGVWHGFAFPVTFIISLFTDKVAVYAVPNSGTWYDFGYFCGIMFLGVGARSSRRRG